VSGAHSPELGQSLGQITLTSPDSRCPNVGRLKRVTTPPCPILTFTELLVQETASLGSFRLWQSAAGPVGALRARIPTG
jgi:hypothetical protein